MADIAASVLTRLKNKAQVSGRSYQLCLQLFCQEEFSIRLLNYKLNKSACVPVSTKVNVRTSVSFR